MSFRKMRGIGYFRRCLQTGSSGKLLTGRPSKQNYEEWLKANEGYFAGVKRLYGRAKEIADRIDPKYWSMITEWFSKSENWEKILGWLDKAKDFVVK
ncbi:hypothetical protein HYR99_06900 [Candidatus Poribacteria bacterium]|nr:hypothetical protein [Candidatus Poribacteria bacterium]